MSDDRMHDRLTDAGTRWRERQPQPHLAVPALRRRSSRLPVYAAAAMVVVVAGTAWAIGRPDDHQRPVSPQSSPSTTPAPTPSGPRACSADDLHVTEMTEGAMGTTYLTLMIDATGGDCRLQGYPDVTMLAHGQPLDVPVQQQPGTDHPVMVTARPSAALTLGWSPTHSCADVDNDTIRVTLPDGSSFDVPGFGQTSCNPGEADLQPLTVQPFTPARS